MSVKKFSVGIETFLAYIHDAEAQYRMAEADEIEANSLTQDILHRIELQEHTHHEYAALSKELKGVRCERRRAKDTLNTTIPIVEWIDANRAVIKGLERLLGEVRKVERSTEGRIYTPRTKKEG